MSEYSADPERFCHICCAGLESSQHNTECVGSDNGLAAHDAQVAADTAERIAQALVAFGEESGIGAYGTYGPPAIAVSDAARITREHGKP